MKTRVPARIHALAGMPQMRRKPSKTWEKIATLGTMGIANLARPRLSGGMKHGKSRPNALRERLLPHPTRLAALQREETAGKKRVKTA